VFLGKKRGDSIAIGQQDHYTEQAGFRWCFETSDLQKIHEALMDDQGLWCEEFYNEFRDIINPELNIEQQSEFTTQFANDPNRVWAIFTDYLNQEKDLYDFLHDESGYGWGSPEWDAIEQSIVDLPVHQLDLSDFFGRIVGEKISNVDMNNQEFVEFLSERINEGKYISLVTSGYHYVNVENSHQITPYAVEDDSTLVVFDSDAPLNDEQGQFVRVPVETMLDQLVQIIVTLHPTQIHEAPPY